MPTPRLLPALLLVAGTGCGHLTVYDTDGGYGEDEGWVEPELVAAEISSPNDWLFGLQGVRTIDITLSDDQYAAVAADEDTWGVGDVTIDGRFVGTVGVKRKGSWGSLRSMDQKAGLKIDFDRFVPGREFYGLEKLTLNNMVQDYAQVHEVVAYKAFEHAGLPSLRVGYAWVTVNGTDYGLYANLETPDDNWLDRSFADGDGNLYEGSYLLEDSWYSFLDFDASVHDLFPLQEGTDVDNADVRAITSTIDSYYGTAEFYDRMGEIIDWDHTLRMWATEIWVQQWDGYFVARNNYHVYFDPSDGKAKLVPWGLDGTFMDWGCFNCAGGRLAQACLGDATCAAEFYRIVDETCDRIDAANLEATTQKAIDLVDPYVQQDPRREISYETAVYYQEDLKTTIAGRSAEVRAYWGL